VTLKRDFIAVVNDRMIFQQEAKLKKQLSAIDRDRSDTISEGGRSLQAVQPVVDKSIALHVYGVDDPGPEITVELVEVLQNRLNEAMLEVLSVVLSRNPNCKLTYADVRVSLKVARKGFLIVIILLKRGKITKKYLRPCG